MSEHTYVLYILRIHRVCFLLVLLGKKQPVSDLSAPVVRRDIPFGYQLLQHPLLLCMEEEVDCIVCCDHDHICGTSYSLELMLTMIASNSDNSIFLNSR